MRQLHNRLDTTTSSSNSGRGIQINNNTMDEKRFFILLHQIVK